MEATSRTAVAQEEEVQFHGQAQRVFPASSQQLTDS